MESKLIKGLIEQYNFEVEESINLKLNLVLSQKHLRLH